MRRLFWIGVGAVATVVVIRKVRGLVDEHTPPGVAQATGMVNQLSSALRSARSEFSAGLTEREAELRRDLLGDVDLDEARTRTDAWRAERRQKAGHAKKDRGSHRGAESSSGGTSRPGRHADDAELAQDPGDGELGYSFY